MKLAIMQPYFLPYLGYFQLVNAVDRFVVYDNIEFTKRGWFHRNRILVDNEDRLFTVPLRNDSDFLDVNQRYLAEDSIKQRRRILSCIKNSYARAPYFGACYPLVEKCLLCSSDNLFEFAFHSIEVICDYMDINTALGISSTVGIDHTLKGQDKVIAICRELHADYYVNPIGGRRLYDKQTFSRNGITLQFLEPENMVYEQFGNDFIPNLSVVDVMMFNSREQMEKMLMECEVT